MAIVGAWGVAALCTSWACLNQGILPTRVWIISYNAPWFRVPTPFQWGMPSFGAANYRNDCRILGFYG